MNFVDMKYNLAFFYGILVLAHFADMKDIQMHQSAPNAQMHQMRTVQSRVEPILAFFSNSAISAIFG